MASTFGARLRHAWNAFKRDPDDIAKSTYRDYGQSFIYRPDRLHLTRGPDKTIIASIYNRISMDVAAVKIEHVRLDDENRYISTLNSPLNNCLTLEANIDQTGRTFIQDAVLTMLDNGCVALVPTETDVNPTRPEGPSFDVLSIRTATIKQWYPKHVQVDIYNEETGLHNQYTLPKSMLAIIENPFYPVMNEPNSTMQRLIRKLTILDAIDEQTGSGKLDMIIQLPYIIKTEERRKQAENRRKDLERQLAESKYGVAYADGTEKIVQLNRPLENNLLSTIEYLTSMLYSQLGITTGILDGTADEQTMLNYNNRIVEPILSVLTDEMKRKFLTKTARSQHQSIKFFIQPFRALPISNVADLANSLARNEIVTPNEFRQILGMKPAPEPQADELHNANMPSENSSGSSNQNGEESEEDLSVEDDELESSLNNTDDKIDELEGMLSHSALKHYIPTPSSYSSPYYDPVKAHEYYMKNRKIKGRGSTAGLNDKGKEVATYVKSEINSEKKKKLEEHSTEYKEILQDLKDQKTAYSEANSENSKAKIKAAQNAKSSKFESISSKSKEDIGTIGDRAKRDTDTARRKRDSEIKQHQASMNSSIDSLKKRLKSMSSDDKKKNRSSILEKINKLREENAADRERIRGDYKVAADKIQTDKKTDTETVRSTARTDKAAATDVYKTTAEEARETRKETQKVINEYYNQSVAYLREASKGAKMSIGEEYTEKWLRELDRIKSVPEYLRTKK